ncbi:ATP-binding protein [Lentibacillus cibarius]|uniref:ATP-binding protein n=1 Tax=Lentibacillus cibarius TaxID=2583219 RepID=UPI0018F8BF9F|nr:ATP-binding protein [Lentibacillus cibarius]
MVAIGVNDGKIEGISEQGNIKINDFVQCKINHCLPTIRVTGCFLEVINDKGKKDQVLLIHVDPRALTKMGWVRELGEGVKRIYKEMDALFLDDPEYTETENTVTLTLKKQHCYA